MNGDLYIVEESRNPAWGSRSPDNKMFFSQALPFPSFKDAVDWIGRQGEITNGPRYSHGRNVARFELGNTVSMKIRRHKGFMKRYGAKL